MPPATLASWHLARQALPPGRQLLYECSTGRRVPVVAAWILYRRDTPSLHCWELCRFRHHLDRYYLDPGS